MTRSLLVLFFFGACGDDGGVNNLLDAPTFDTAPPGMASVTIRIGRVPAPNRTVYFQGPDGAEIASVQTDANGKASAVVPGGSSVTALDIIAVRNGGARNVVTIMGVQPGDELTLTGNFDLPPSNITFSYSAYTGTAAPLYAAVTNCNNDEAGQGTTSTLTVARCAPRFDAMMFVVDGLGNASAYMAKPDQPFGNVDFSGETWAAVPMVGSTYTNVPTTALVQSARRITSPRGPLFVCNEVTGGKGPTYVAEMPCASFAGATTLDVASFTEAAISFEVTHAITSAAPTLDLADTLIKGPAYSSRIDLATRVVTWEESTTGADPDFIVATITSTDLDWRVFAPYRAPSLTLPRLVGDAAAYDLEAGDSPYAGIIVGTATGGYDAIRRFGPNYLDSITTEITRIITAGFSDG